MSSPLLYEINTRCWLRELSEKSAAAINLTNVPEMEFEEWQRLGFTHIWLMGVWTCGPRSRSAALSHPDQRRAYDETLPGWVDADIGASPYSISAYVVPASLGGNSGLANFRKRLNDRGLKLILDFVPNHVGLDHPWLEEHPEYLVQCAPESANAFPWETVDGTRWFAHGRDPYMPPWTDTIQIDYRVPAARAAMAVELASIAQGCDGVRCDMAMLVLQDVFAATWQNFPPPRLSEALDTTVDAGSDFFTDIIPQIKAKHPGFVFLAEVYWGLEARLQSLGFDYTYDKTLYDRLVAHDSMGVQRHLLGMGQSVVSHCAHFLENHDEPRIASALSLPEHRAAAALILTLPGMRFLHEGQLGGAKKRVPVQMLRRPEAPLNQEIRSTYEELLALLPATFVGRGQCELLTPKEAGLDNPTGQDFVLIQWGSESEAFDLVVINLANHQSQCFLPLSSFGASTERWKAESLFGKSPGAISNRNGGVGVYLDLPEFGIDILRLTVRPS